MADALVARAPAPPVFQGDVRAIESRAEIESLETLQAERRKLIGEWAPLAAKFRGAGRGDDSKRKQHRALIGQQIREELFEKWRGDGAKGTWKEPADNMLERMANADPRHLAFCGQLDEEFVRYVLLENEIAERNERIKSREIELMAYNAEVRLAR